MFVIILLLGFVQHFEKPKVLQIQPIDVNIAQEPFYFQRIDQLETDGELIYIRGILEPSIIVINPKGEITKKIGQKGEGPGEFKNEITAISLDRSAGRLWVLTDRSFRGTVFDLNGTHINTFKFPHGPYMSYTTSSNVFATHDDVMVNASGGMGIKEPLGIVYDFKKNETKILGEIEQGLDPLILKGQRAFHDTLWLFSLGKWYCLSKFHPMIQVFDNKFKLIGKQTIQNDWLQYKHLDEMEKVLSKEKDHIFTLFSDFKFHKGFLFAMAPGQLLKIDPTTWDVVQTYQFKGEGEQFPKISDEYLHLFFNLFTILDDDTIVLGVSDLSWDHDLWKSKLR